VPDYSPKYRRCASCELARCRLFPHCWVCCCCWSNVKLQSHIQLTCNAVLSAQLTLKSVCVFSYVVICHVSCCVESIIYTVSQKTGITLGQMLTDCHNSLLLDLLYFLLHLHYLMKYERSKIAKIWHIQHNNTGRTETFVPLIYRIINHTFLQATRQTQHTLLWFINVINVRLAELLLHFSSKFCSQLGPDLDCSEPQVWWIESWCLSVQKANCLTNSLCRSTVLLEDKELARDLTHDRQ